MKALAIYIALILTYFAPTTPMVLLVGAFIAFDTVFGVYTAVKLKGRKSITSWKMLRFAAKILFYTPVILLAYGLETTILAEQLNQESLYLTKFTALILVLVEGFSIDENLRKVNDDKGVVYYVDKAVKIIRSGKDKINSIFSKGKIDED